MKGTCGDRITTLSQLHALAQVGRSVCYTEYDYKAKKVRWVVRPAAWAINWSGFLIQMQIGRGLWLYLKEVKPCP